MTTAPPSESSEARSVVADAAARREYRLLKWGTLVALALACAVPLALNLVDPDLWGHLLYGQELLAEQQLPRTATHTFTAVGHPWINHESLAELALALGYRHLGTYGLLVAKCLLGMSILGAMVWIAARRGVHPFLAWALMLLVAANLQAFFPLRPQLLSFALCAMVLVLLDRAFAGWQTQRKVHWGLLWLAPPLFAVWVNSHGGFVAGLCIVGAYLAGRMLELLVSGGRSAWPTMLKIAAVGLACLAATLINPYGLEMHRWLIASLGSPRPEITEWAAPKLSDPIFAPLVALLAVAAASWLGTQKRRDWVQIAIVALVAWQACLHLRHIAFLALLCGFWLPEHLQSALARLRPAKSGATGLPTIMLAPWLRRSAVLALSVGIGLQSLALAGRLTDLPVYRSAFPVDAVQFMVDHHLNGKLVACFNWSQYAVAALQPEVQVGFDGRFRTCYPQQVVDMHFDFLLGEFGGKRFRSLDSGPLDGTRVLDYCQPDLVLVERRYKTPVGIMRAASTGENRRWVLLFRDRIAELWGRRDRYDDPASPHYFPVASRLQDPRPRDGAVQWPAMPLREDGSQFAWQQAPPAAIATDL